MPRSLNPQQDCDQLLVDPHLDLRGLARTLDGLCRLGLALRTRRAAFCCDWGSFCCALQRFGVVLRRSAPFWSLLLRSALIKLGSFCAALPRCRVGSLRFVPDCCTISRKWARTLAKRPTRWRICRIKRGRHSRQLHASTFRHGLARSQPRGDRL